MRHEPAGRGLATVFRQITAQGASMNIKGSVALVTGANRGICLAIARALLERSARAYTGAGNPHSITDPELVPVRLDITDAAEVTAIAIPTRSDGRIEHITSNRINAGAVRRSPLREEP
jgi:NAD(P)-dependent dehydrogenase (short-subunit alcohol dehydrogenase family)